MNRHRSVRRLACKVRRSPELCQLKHCLSTRFDPCIILETIVATLRHDVRRGRYNDSAPTTLACCVVFSAFLPGCSHSVPVQSYTEPDAVPPTPVVLEVENHNWADVVLYVLHDGIQTRFAQVAAAHNASIQIPSQLQGQMGIIRIAARRIGG